MSNAPRDCDCFLFENYFVDKVCERTLRWHFSYDGSDKSIKEQLISLGLVDGAGLSQTEYSMLKRTLDTERDRRLDNRDAARREACAARMEGKRGAAAYRLITSGAASWLDERCTAAFRAASQPSASRADVLSASGGREVIPGRVFALPIFTKEACALLDSELTSYAAICRDVKERPNSMNRYGVLLDEAGMSGGVTDPLLWDVIVPIGKVLFGTPRSDAATGGTIVGPMKDDDARTVREMCATLDHHHAFTVDYKSDPNYDRDLALHFDNAELTLNVLIGGDDFEGGDLAFEGPSQASFPSYGGFRFPVPYEHRLGWGIFHLGSELHRALPVEEGSRRNLIVWCRSARHRLSHGCPMCGSKDRLVENVLNGHLRVGLLHDARRVGWD